MAKLKAGWIETRKLADGSHRALLRYRDPLTGQKHTYGDALYADTAKEAEGKAGELQPDLAQFLKTRKQAKRDPQRMALGDWVLGGWRSDFEPKLPSSTWTNMRQSWSKWLGPLVGNVPLAEISPPLVEGLVEHMEEVGASWPTVEQAVKHLRTYVRDAVIADVLADNQIKDFKLEAPELTAEEIAQLSEPEFALELEHSIRIAWCLNGLEDTALAEAMAVGGLRFGEARALTFHSVLHPDGRARGRFQVRLAVSGRGSQRELRGTKKTRGRSRRAIERGFRSPLLPPSLGALFERLYTVRGEPKLSELLAPGDPDAALGVKNEANWRRREFAPAIRRSEVQASYPGKVITPREFRASAAAAHGHAQEPELSARAQLGHSSDSTTLRYYFSAYEDPKPELRGKSIEWQLRRARRLTLEWMERELEAVTSQREACGKHKLLSWSKKGPTYAADSVNCSRYEISNDDDGWQIVLVKEGDLRPGRQIVKTGLESLNSAKARAERHALKRTRQSLTIQRQRLEGQLEHLRALVDAAGESGDDDGAGAASSPFLAAAGTLTGQYPAGYLGELREEWQESGNLRGERAGVRTRLEG